MQMLKHMIETNLVKAIFAKPGIRQSSDGRRETHSAGELYGLRIGVKPQCAIAELFGNVKKIAGATADVQERSMRIIGRGKMANKMVPFNLLLGRGGGNQITNPDSGRESISIGRVIIPDFQTCLKARAGNK